MKHTLAFTDPLPLKLGKVKEKTLTTKEPSPLRDKHITEFEKGDYSLELLKLDHLIDSANTWLRESKGDFDPWRYRAMLAMERWSLIN